MKLPLGRALLNSSTQIWTELCDTSFCAWCFLKKIEVFNFCFYSQRLQLGSRLRHQINHLYVFYGYSTPRLKIGQSPTQGSASVTYWAAKKPKTAWSGAFSETEKSDRRKKMEKTALWNNFKSSTEDHSVIESFLRKEQPIFCVPPVKKESSIQNPFSSNFLLSDRQSEWTQFEFRGRCLAHSDKNWGIESKLQRYR